MKKVKNRAFSALLIAIFLALGLISYSVSLYRNGEDWALFRGNLDVYKDGILKDAAVTDRNGLVLAKSSNGVYYYADEPGMRKSCLHAAGDFEGYIGTGAVTAFASRLAGYGRAEGTYSLGGGGSISLTIDAELNRAAYEALGGRRGCVILMNYMTGEVICMTSSPSYDPNSPPDTGDSQYEGVYINRAISSSFTPGSVFKIVTLAAALENIRDLASRTFWCSGSITVDGRLINCSGVHGNQTAEQAFANSCNCAFAEISLELGGEKLSAYAENYGLLSSHSLSGISTAKGRFDISDDGSAELAWSGIGQYNDLLCPFSLLRLVSAIAGEGYLAEPRLLLPSESENLIRALGGASPKKFMDAETAASLRDMMENNTASSYGSWRFPGLSVCAKTGTAEVEGALPHAWFAGFLRDAENPIAFVVLVENGGGGLSAAGAVANSVLQAAVK